MREKEKKRLTAKFLGKKKVPQVLIAGLVMASVLGWTGWKKLENVKNYYLLKRIFPIKAYAQTAVDGDTIMLANGLSVRLIGINAPGRGEEKYDKSREYLQKIVTGKQISLEYERYQDDKYGRILAYVWVDCTEDLKAYCHGDKYLVNEVMIKKQLAQKSVYKDRKRLKYEEFL